MGHSRVQIEFGLTATQDQAYSMLESRRTFDVKVDATTISHISSFSPENARRVLSFDCWIQKESVISAVGTKRSRTLKKNKSFQTIDKNSKNFFKEGFSGIDTDLESVTSCNIGDRK